MAKRTPEGVRRTGVRLVDGLTRIQERGLPLEDQVVLAQAKECLEELLRAPVVSDVVLEHLRSGTEPTEWPGSPTARTRDVLRSLSESGRREYIRQLLSKATKTSERAVIEASLWDEFGEFFP